MKKNFKSRGSKKGFTLLEVLLVIAILTILSAVGIGYFHSSIVEVAAGSTMKTFVADIDAARGRALVGDRGMTWGVLVDATANTWELYATTTRNYSADEFIPEIHPLPSGVVWIDPKSGTRSIEFLPLSGASITTSFTMGYGAVKLQAAVDGTGGVRVTRIGG